MTITPEQKKTKLEREEGLESDIFNLQFYFKESLKLKCLRKYKFKFD